MDQNSHPRGKTWRYCFYHSHRTWKPRRDYSRWKNLQASRPRRYLFIVCPRCTGQHCHQSLLLWCICKCVQSIKSTEYLHSHIRQSRPKELFRETFDQWSSEKLPFRRCICTQSRTYPRPRREMDTGKAEFFCEREI